jgi:DNA repair protein RecN (Recombination protein N)
MLGTLRVKNLAVVENARVEFEPGLNVITGETGAGKSLLVGALQLLLGDRADRKMIRTGEDTCGAEAVLGLDDPADVDAILGRYGLGPCDGRQLIVRRILKASGSSQNLVNDAPVTLQVLKDVGQRLFDLHGPHDHQSLLSPAFQADVLDAYGGLEAERKAYAEAFARVEDLKARRLELEGAAEDIEAQMDLLAHRVREIEEAAPVEGEEERLAREHLVVAHAQRILELGRGISTALAEGEATAFDLVAGAQRQLEELAKLLPDAEAWRAEARSIAVQIDELSRAVTSSVERVEADPARLEWLEQRLAVYQRIRRKYAATVEGVLAVLEQSRQRLQDLRSRGERLAAVDREAEAARAELLKAGEVLSRKRRPAAGRLAEAVTAELRALGFPKGAFDVGLGDAEPRTDGMDAVEFGFAPNAGEAMRPLRDIASSGEISRVMLATKAVLSAHDRIPVLIFDEIDANLGGEMGHAVGRKLAWLARRHQVICITHLPQVAAFGSAHFAVRKCVREGRTFAEVVRLDAEGRVEEIARMLGGRDATRVTLQHARELLERARGAEHGAGGGTQPVGPPPGVP